MDNDVYEVVNADGTVVYQTPVYIPNDNPLNSIIAYAIGYTSNGAKVTIRRVTNGKVFFSFKMEDTSWNPYETQAPTRA
jgi:hypothetical protein